MVRRLVIAVPWLLALVVGMLLAVGSVPILLFTADWYREWNYENNPPVELSWNSVQRIDANLLRITMLVKRNDDCQMVRALGYTGPTLQAMQPVDSFAREDGNPPQSYPVGISVISRPWILRGIYGDKVAISVYFDCDNRIVKAPLLVGVIPEAR